MPLLHTWGVYAVFCLLQVSQVDGQLFCVAILAGCIDVHQQTARGVNPFLLLPFVFYAQLANMRKLPGRGWEEASNSRTKAACMARDRQHSSSNCGTATAKPLSHSLLQPPVLLITDTLVIRPFLASCRVVVVCQTHVQMC